MYNKETLSFSIFIGMYIFFCIFKSFVTFFDFSYDSISTNIIGHRLFYHQSQYASCTALGPNSWVRSRHSNIRVKRNGKLVFSSSFDMAFEWHLVYDLHAVLQYWRFLYFTWCANFWLLFELDTFASTLEICLLTLGVQMDFVTEAMMCKVFRPGDGKRKIAVLKNAEVSK